MNGVVDSADSESVAHDKGPFKHSGVVRSATMDSPIADDGPISGASKSKIFLKKVFGIG